MSNIQLNDDTIVAPATAAGVGAIAIIRISGKKAFEIADAVFVSKKKNGENISSQSSHTIHFGWIQDGDKNIDEVLISIFKNPHSYTGEDVIEISCHGSLFIQQQIIQLILKLGARSAEPGEFTLRAFMNGKMDLSQAEAVADLIASDSAASHDLALKQMRGGYSSEMKQLRDQLINFASLIELELDFSEEDVEFADRKELAVLISHLIAHISSLISSFELGNVLKQGIPVVIAGKPNVGKSTLLNALLNEERAIVSHIAGTTRDTIEEEIVLSGIKFRFIDTAGLRETSDAIESIGVNRTMEKINQSPILIYMFDVTESTAAGLKEELDKLKKDIPSTNFKVILAGNKMDTSDQQKLEQEFKSLGEVIFISAKQKINLSLLTQKLLEEINLSTRPDNFIVTNARHVEALQNTNASLQNVLEGLHQKRSGDLLSPDIRNALYHLGLITGEVTNDTLLANIFGKFCIGK
ncbi:tRNA uridine-5-carboxymethylaminomethyl(34) synthesis GTPase MnmE [soil metagenome]